MLHLSAELPSTPVAVGTDFELAEMVREQVLTGLRSGVLEARIFVTAPARVAPPPPSGNQSEYGDDDRLIRQSPSAVDELDDDDPGPSEDGAPRLRQFTVKREFWAASPIVELDWSSSTLTVFSQHLYDASTRASRPVDECFEIPDPIEGAPVKIVSPEKTLRDLFRYEPLPDAEWLDRYKVYRKMGRIEAVTAAWRYIAVVTSQGTKLPSAAQLAERIEEYLISQGFEAQRAEHDKIRNSTLQELAKQVLAQFETRNLSDTVLVSGNPRRRQRV
jgi:hypothetical protein